MPCSTNSGLPMLGCCGPQNPCAPTQFYVSGGITVDANGPAVLTNPLLMEVHSHALQFFNSLAIPAGILQTWAISYTSDFTTVQFGSPRLFASSAPECNAATSIEDLSWNIFPNLPRTGRVTMRKIRLSSTDSFCARTFTDIVFDENGNGNAGNLIRTQPFAPGEYEITAIAAPLVAAGSTGFGTSGSTRIIITNRSGSPPGCIA
jgi:hypothetical protein